MGQASYTRNASKNKLQLYDRWHRDFQGFPRGKRVSYLVSVLTPMTREYTHAQIAGRPIGYWGKHIWGQTRRSPRGRSTGSVFPARASQLKAPRRVAQLVSLVEIF